MRVGPERTPSEHLESFSTPRGGTQRAAGPLPRAQAANDLAACPFGAMKGSTPRRWMNQVAGRDVPSAKGKSRANDLAACPFGVMKNSTPRPKTNQVHRTRTPRQQHLCGKNHVSAVPRRKRGGWPAMNLASKMLEILDLAAAAFLFVDRWFRGHAWKPWTCRTLAQFKGSPGPAALRQCR